MEDKIAKFKLTRMVCGHETSWEGSAMPVNAPRYSYIDIPGNNILAFIPRLHLEQVLNFIKLLEEK